MVEQFNLVSVEGRKVPKWAEEDTLQDIRDLLTTQVQYLTRQQITDRQEQTIERKKHQKEEKAEKEQIGLLGNLYKGIGGLTGMTARLIKAVIAGGSSVETVIKKSMQRMVESVSDIGGPAGNIVGLALSGLVGTLVVLTSKISDASESFKTLYDTGFSLSGQLGNLYIEAGKSAMTLNEYSQVLEGHSVSIKALTNQYERGEIVFGRYSRGVRELLYSQGQLLLSTSELNDFLGEYLETQRLMGRLEAFDRIKEQNYMREYLTTLTQLTRISGKRRDQLFEEVESFTRRVDISAVLSTYPEQVAESVREMIAGVSNIPGIPETFREAFAQLLQFGTFSTQETAMFRQMPRAAEAMTTMAEKARQGLQITTDDIEWFYGELKASAEELQQQPALLRAWSAAQTQGIATFHDLLESYQAFLSLNLANTQNLRDNNDALIRLIGNWNTLINTALEPFNDILGRTINLLADAFEKRNITGKIISAFESVHASLTSILTSQNLEDAINWLIIQFTRVIDWTLKLFTDEGRQEIKDNLLETMRDVGTFMGDKILEGALKALNPVNWVLSGDEGAQVGKQERLDVVNEIRRLNQGILNLQKTYDDLILKEDTKLKDLRHIESMIQERRNKIDELSKQYNITSPENVTGYARGGVATLPSVFGESGPEAAIPLDTGKRIPIAEIKGDFNKKELKTIADLMGKFVERQSMIIEQNDKMIRRLEGVRTTISRSGERIV